jgi:hypothetical protein
MFSLTLEGHPVYTMHPSTYLETSKLSYGSWSKLCEPHKYVTDFFLNNQPDALIIPILFCYKTPHVSGIFSAHHQEFPTVHSALVSFMHVSVAPS